MTRINKRFKNLANKKNAALIPYITAGLPTLESTVTLMHEMVDAGADCIELGVPFSDPMADGPVIQLANEKALSQGVTIIEVLEMVRQFRQRDETTPIILMGYLNPIEQMGYRKFANYAEEVGVDAVITVDLPAEESATLSNALEGKPVEIIYLVAPTTTEKRLNYISEVSRSFIYYVSVKGITGSSKLDTYDAQKNIEKIRNFSTCSIGIGFGIKDECSAAKAAQVADAIIIGSALIERIEDEIEPSIKNIKKFLSSINKAIKLPNQTEASNYI